MDPLFIASHYGQGLLTKSPKAFEHCKTIAQFYTQTPGRGTAVSINSGIRIDLLMAKDEGYPNGQIYVAVLDCPIGNVPGRLAGIRLLRLSHRGDHYARIDMRDLFQFALLTEEKIVDIRGFDPTAAQTCLTEEKSSEWNLTYCGSCWIR